MKRVYIEWDEKGMRISTDFDSEVERVSLEEVLGAFERAKLQVWKHIAFDDGDLNDIEEKQASTTKAKQ